MASPIRSLRSRRVLVDTSAYLAIIDQHDEHHRSAITSLTELAQAHYRQYTTNVLIIEAHALIMSRLGTDIGRRFLRDMQRGNTVVLRDMPRQHCRRPRPRCR